MEILKKVKLSNIKHFTTFKNNKKVNKLRRKENHLKILNDIFPHDINKGILF